jgi:O-antigen/teichoic acid export membrane protein
VLQIQAAAILGSFLAVALAYDLLSLHRHAALLVSNCLGLILSLALTLALVPSLGAKGAAIATAAGEFALAVAYFVALRRAALRLPLRIVLPVAGATGIAATLVFAGLSSLALAAAVGTVYVVLLFVFRAVPPEVVEAFTALARHDSKLA